MRYLVDTHILLWWVENSKKLKSSVKQILADPLNTLYISVASGLEICIKCHSGKLKLKTTLEDCFVKSGFEVLNITLPHVVVFDRLPSYHKDPFDRVLIAQAKADNLTLITSDAKIWKYEQVLVGSHNKLPLIKA